MKELIDKLENKLINLIDLKSKNVNFPCKFPVLGFPVLELNNKDELEGRIKELGDILWRLKTQH